MLYQMYLKGMEAQYKWRYISLQSGVFIFNLDEQFELESNTEIMLFY